MKKRILIIDDELTIGTGCKRVLEKENFEVYYQQSGRSGLKEALTGEYNLILLDLLLPEIEGMEILKAIKSKEIPSEVIIITGYATVQTAVEALKLGAADYISKPFSPDELIIQVNKVFQHMDLRNENIALRKELSLEEGFNGIIGESASMKQIFKLIKRVAPTESNILITGESGVGKELVARVIHQLSNRQGKFVCENIAGLDDTMISDTLFGHAKGAFTDAEGIRKGLVEEAAGVA